jgi:hypothetical protein
MTEAISRAEPRAFTVDEAAYLQSNETTSQIAKRTTKTGEDIAPGDRSHERVVRDQKEQVGGWGVVELALTTHDAASLGVLDLALAPAIEIGVSVASPLAALIVGGHSIVAAHANADEQKAALTKQALNAAVVSGLDLPTAYQEHRMNVDFHAVPREHGTPAYKMAEALEADPKAIEKLQLHCDRGMNAAREAVRCGMTKAAYLAANPKDAAAYASDVAFHEGFDGMYEEKKSGFHAADLERLEQRLDGRNGWYGQAHVQVRA